VPVAEIACEDVAIIPEQFRDEFGHFARGSASVQIRDAPATSGGSRAGRRRQRE
jgi:hypothetical protein